MVAAAKKKGRKPRAKKNEIVSKDNPKNAKLSKKAKKPKGPPKKRGRKPKGGKILQGKPNDDISQQPKGEAI